MTGELLPRGRSPLDFDLAEELMAGGLGPLTTASIYRLLAIAVLTAHLVWILWVVAGWLGTRRRPWLGGFHVLSVVYSLLIEILPWPCPLTILEQGLEARAGIEPYREPFLIHYLEAVVYPDIPPRLLIACAIAVCVAILAVHGIRLRGHPAAG